MYNKLYFSYLLGEFFSKGEQLYYLHSKVYNSYFVFMSRIHFKLNPLCDSETYTSHFNRCNQRNAKSFRFYSSCRFRRKVFCHTFEVQMESYNGVEYRLTFFMVASESSFGHIEKTSKSQMISSFSVSSKRKFQPPDMTCFCKFAQ